MKPDSSTLQVRIAVSADHHDLLVAVLDGLGYDAFEEQADALLAFIGPEHFDAPALTQALTQWLPGSIPDFTTEAIAERDWNAEWEANFESVLVDDFCEIRPPFRAASGTTQHEVVVMPKMAFGTGHHATTWLMVDRFRQLDVAGAQVLDMGCGTGVLGILAHKLGAAEVTLIDIDAWSTENTAENARLNGAKGLTIIRGEATSIPEEGCYDILLANINRNVLIADRDHFLRHLRRGGELVLSGIYDFDEAKLTAHYLAAGLDLVDRAERNEWVRLAFRHSPQPEKKIAYDA